MKLYIDKVHLFLNNQKPNALKKGHLHINNSLSEKLLVVTFDCKVKFNKDIEDIGQKSIAKVNCICNTCNVHGNNQKKYFLTKQHAAVDL